MAGWTTPATAAAGELTSAFWNAQVRDNFNAINGFAVKTADEGASSSTLQNDNHLAYSIPVAGTYVIECHLLVTGGNNAGDFKVGFSFPTGTLSFGVVGLVDTLASGQSGDAYTGAFSSATSGSSAITVGISASANWVRVNGLLTATATGTLQLIWAQGSTNATATTVAARSFMTVRQVA